MKTAMGKKTQIFDLWHLFFYDWNHDLMKRIHTGEKPYKSRYIAIAFTASYASKTLYKDCKLAKNTDSNVQKKTSDDIRNQLRRCNALCDIVQKLLPLHFIMTTDEILLTMIWYTLAVWQNFQFITKLIVSYNLWHIPLPCLIVVVVWI